jgi:hypothetical protein
MGRDVGIEIFERDWEKGRDFKDEYFHSATNQPTDYTELRPS